MAYEQEPGRGQSAFGEVLKSRGLINTISNPKAAKKQASDIRIARLKEQENAKPKDANPTFYTMEAFKPEATLENPKPIRQYYKTERTADKCVKLLKKLSLILKVEMFQKEEKHLGKTRQVEPVVEKTLLKINMDLDLHQCRQI